MFLHFNSSLTAVPESPTEDFLQIIRLVEAKKLQLEGDIKQYIANKQVELQKYEQEVPFHDPLSPQIRGRGADPRKLLEQKRPIMSTSPLKSGEDVSSPDHNQPSASASSSSIPKPERSSSSEDIESEDTAKPTKLSRVHKREKELHGLVTPLFLPLLDAQDSSPSVRKKSRSKSAEGKEMTSPATPKGKQPSDIKPSDESKDPPEKKDKGKEKERARRPVTKKSALRQNGAPKERRKRVSLRIERIDSESDKKEKRSFEIVHPSDSIADPAPTSPTSETTYSSASASTSSLESTLESRTSTSPSPHEPVHHSLPVPVSPAIPVATAATVSSKNLATSPSTLQWEQDHPSTTGRTFLDPSPTIAAPGLPPVASPAPIYATSPVDVEPDLVSDHIPVPQSSYVGGFSGSNVDGVDQAGSYGYPSSLGASYMESYMQTRPLSVRLAAQEKAGVAGAAVAREQAVVEEEEEAALETRRGAPQLGAEAGDNDDMGIMGDMEGF